MITLIFIHFIQYNNSNVPMKAATQSNKHIYMLFLKINLVSSDIS